MIFRVFSKRQKRHTWAINLTVDGQRIRHSGFATKQEAEEAVAALRLRQRARRFGLEIDSPEITLAELLTARRRDPATASSSTRSRALHFFEDFVALTGPEVPVKSVSLSHLRAYREGLHHKPATIQFKMGGVIAALNAAGTYFPELEGYACPRLRGLAVKGRSVLVPRTEFLKLLEALRASDRPNHPRIADVLELLALTGARVSEILNLDARQIDLDRQVVTIHATKTNTTRLIPLSPRAAQLLAGWTPPPFSYFSMRHSAMLRAKRIGITLHGAETWHIHDIRHTAASILAEAGTSHSVIAALLGHTLAGTTARYTHASLKALRDAVLVLEGWCTPRPALSLVG